MDIPKRKPRHFDILVRLADGWEPFVFQLSGTFEYFNRKGWVGSKLDPAGRVVAFIRPEATKVVDAFRGK